jgi:hypothetical protein
MDQPPFPPALPAKKVISTGCIIGTIVTIVGIAVFALLMIVFGSRIMGKKELMYGARLVALVVAIKGYQTEYNRFPPLPEHVTSESAAIVSSGSFLDALLGERNDFNPRHVKFLEPEQAKYQKNGLLDKDDKRTLVDKWGIPYYILLDINRDGKIPDPERPGAMINTTVVVFSGGPDGDPATWQDNVTSWK